MPGRGGLFGQLAFALFSPRSAFFPAPLKARNISAMLYINNIIYVIGLRRLPLAVCSQRFQEGLWKMKKLSCCNLK